MFEGAGEVVVRGFVDGRAGEVLVGEGDVAVGGGVFSHHQYLVSEALLSKK